MGTHLLRGIEIDFKLNLSLINGSFRFEEELKKPEFQQISRERVNQILRFQNYRTSADSASYSWFATSMSGKK